MRRVQVRDLFLGLHLVLLNGGKMCLMSRDNLFCNDGEFHQATNETEQGAGSGRFESNGLDPFGDGQFSDRINRGLLMEG